MADYLGQQFGTYRLTQWLGRGGFADIYLGEHVHMGTRAAVKILHIQSTRESLQQFLAEARTIAQLDHPHIVRVLDFDIQDNIPFLVMNYAPHGSLRDRHPRKTRVPLSTIVTYTKQIADALHYAHERKLIHRDIKPENLLVSHDNQILLSDFGLALITQSSGSQTSDDMIGTVPYSAPEQIQGKPRRASDQYSLGVVIYEWLSGNYPFTGSVFEIAYQHMNVAPPSLRKQYPTIPVDVEKVVMIALAKDPQKRFANMQAFARALEQAAGDEINRPTQEKYSSSTTDSSHEAADDSHDQSTEAVLGTIRAERMETLPANDTPPSQEQHVVLDSSTPDTPYQTVFLFNQRLLNPSEFFGRVRDRETLLNRTRNSASTSIVGPRRIGKTWLMNYLLLVAPTLPRARFRVGYLDASMASCATIVGFTNAALEELGVAQFVPNSANQALALLERAIQDLKARGLQALLCIDEFEGFGKRQEFTFDFFASLRGMTQTGLSLVVASKAPLIDIVGEDGKTSNFFNVFEQLTLEPFTLEEAQEFAESKGQQAGLNSKERQCLLHYGKTGEDQWSPLRLQLVGELLHGDKLLAQHKGPQYYRPDDPHYWQEFEQRMEKKYRSVVP